MTIIALCILFDFRSRINMKNFIKAVVLIAATCSVSTPAKSDVLLEGYVSDIGFSLMVVMLKSKAAISVRGARCLAIIEGQFSRISRNRWVISAEDPEAPCDIILTEEGRGAVTTKQGPSCSHYHGAACGFSGSFTKPSKANFSSLFDP